MRTVAAGDWPARLLTAAEVCVGAVALVGIAAWLTLNPILLLVFLFGQPLLLVGVALFAAAAVTGRKPVLIERFAAGAIVPPDAGSSPFVYVVKSGELDVVRALDGGSEERVAHYQAGDHFGSDLAATGGGARGLRIRAATPVELMRVRSTELATLLANVPALRSAGPSVTIAAVATPSHRPKTD